MKHCSALLIALPLTLAMALAAAAQTDCPAIDLRTDERQNALAQLAEATSPATADLAAQKMWEIWMDAPDEKAQFMLDDGMARRASFNLADAEIILDALISYCPDYPEGWNQRAFVRYLRQDFEGALEDIARTLELEPAHFGALSGKALALMGLGRPGLAKLAMTEAVKVHPFLSERGLLGDAEDI